jgi:hypothetical protein
MKRSRFSEAQMGFIQRQSDEGATMGEVLSVPSVGTVAAAGAWATSSALVSHD